MLRRRAHRRRPQSARRPRARHGGGDGAGRLCLDPLALGADRRVPVPCPRAGPRRHRTPSRPRRRARPAGGGRRREGARGPPLHRAAQRRPRRPADGRPRRRRRARVPAPRRRRRSLVARAEVDFRAGARRRRRPTGPLRLPPVRERGHRSRPRPHVGVVRGRVPARLRVVLPPRQRSRQHWDLASPVQPARAGRRSTGSGPASSRARGSHRCSVATPSSRASSAAWPIPTGLGSLPLTALSDACSSPATRPAPAIPSPAKGSPRPSARGPTPPPPSPKATTPEPATRPGCGRSSLASTRSPGS